MNHLKIRAIKTEFLTAALLMEDDRTDPVLTLQDYVRQGENIVKEFTSIGK